MELALFNRESNSGLCFQLLEVEFLRNLFFVQHILHLDSLEMLSLWGVNPQACSEEQSTCATTSCRLLDPRKAAADKIRGRINQKQSTGRKSTILN